MHISYSNTDKLNLLASFPAAQAVNIAKAFSIPLPPLAGNNQIEHWATNAPVQFENKGSLQIASTEDYLLIGISQPNPDHSLRKFSYQCYQQLLKEVADNHYPHIIKCWNFIPAINQGTGEQENYKQFCIGRAEAFEDANATDLYVPAGTAVGCEQQQNLTIFLLAGKTRPTPVENPRQISAYQYPQQYGPRSPSFSRAACYPLSDNRKAMFLSGTAAIVGHESQHHNNGIEQLRETKKNVEALLANADMPPLSAFSDNKRNQAIMRLFIKSGEHQNSILMHHQTIFPEFKDISILESDICRSELLVEIEGIFITPN